MNLNLVKKLYKKDMISSGLFSEREISSYCSDLVFEKHNFYLQLVSLFKPLFTNVKESEVESISTISYLYFRALLALDTVVDDNNIFNLKLSLYNYELATKKINFLYSEDSEIWSEFDLIKSQYFEGLKLEGSLDFKNGLSDYNKFEFLAKSKSIFILLVPKMLSYCSGCFDYLKQLEISLLSLHVGLQILDDINDFLEDIEKSQVTYVNTTSRKNLKNLGVEIDLMSNVELYKYYIASGLVLEHLDIAENNFNIALASVEELPIIDYKKYIHKLGYQQVKEKREMISKCLSTAKLKNNKI